MSLRPPVFGGAIRAKYTNEVDYGADIGRSGVVHWAEEYRRQEVINANWTRALKRNATRKWRSGKGKRGGGAKKMLRKIG